MLNGNIDLFNIGSANGLLSDGTKPLPEPVLSQMCSVASILEQYYLSY